MLLLDQPNPKQSQKFFPDQLDSCRVVMEWLPLAAVPVPVESGGRDVHVEVVSDLGQHHVECWTVLAPLRPIIGYEMGVSAPG